METEVINGWVTTGHQVEKYGGVQLANEVLDQFAALLRTNNLPMQLDHDALNRVDARVLVAEVRDMPDGVKGVWAEIEVPAGTAEGKIGFSYAASLTTYKVGAPDAPPIGLFVDSEEISADDVRAAADLLAGSGLRVEAGPYMQFSVATDAVSIVLTIGLDLAVSIAGAALYDAIKALTKKGQPTEVRLEISGPDDRRIKAVVRTNDPDVAREALDQLGSIADTAVLLNWTNGEWEERG